MSKIKHVTDDDVILSIFQDIINHNNVIPNSDDFVKNDVTVLQSANKGVVHSYISQDDVLDLKIDLHNCKTFEDVMRLVCQK
jgi:hypothetical protein